jgi:hypothetical protein
MGRNCFLKHAIERQMERRISAMKGRGRIRKQLLDNYFKKIEDTVD